MKEELGMRRTMKSMVLVLMLCIMTVSVRAQVFLTADDDIWNYRDDPEIIGQIPVLPMNLDSDWIPEEYVPFGSGVLLLAGFCGAYLLRKRKKKE